jgi:thiaminase/transcriptional activator TenA
MVDGGVEADVVVNCHLACAAHLVITSLINHHNNINLPAPVISCHFQSSNQSTIKHIKFGTSNGLTMVKNVQQLVQNIDIEKHPAIINSKSVNQSDKYMPQATTDSLMSFYSVFIITYDIAIHLYNNKHQFIRNVAVNNIGEESKMKCVLLPDHHPASYKKNFSTAVTAYLMRDNLPLNVAIYYSHIYLTVKECIHSPFLRISTLTFTQELWSSVDTIYHRMLELPFLNKMLDSTLDENIYNYYIVQDYQFFIDREHMLTGLVEQCTNDEVREFFNILLNKNKKYVQTILCENNLPPCDENTMQKTPACMKYTKLVLKLGRCRGKLSWIKGLIALLPCPLVYAKVGDWMIARGVCPTIKRYADCIDTHRDQARRNRLIGFLQLINRVVNNCSYAQRQQLKRLFQKICKYEYAFWNDAYQYGMQEVNELIKNNTKKAGN